MSSTGTNQEKRNTSHRKVFVIWTNKGGVGKTTLSFHIATTFAGLKLEEGWKVLVCDLCPQANISMTLLTPQKPARRTSNGAASPTEDMYEGEDIVNKFCQERLRPDFEIYRTVAGYIHSFVSRKPEAKVPPHEFLVRPCEYNSKIPGNIHLLCGDPDLGVSCERLEHHRRADPGGDGEEPWRESTLALREFVDKACDGIDPHANWLVIIDTNPALTTYTQLALVAADQIIMPVNADDFSKVAAKALFEHLYRAEPEGVRFSKLRQLTFAYKAKEHKVPLPRVRLVVNNRQTIYATRACHSFGLIEKMINDTLFELFKEHPDRFVSGQKLADRVPDDRLPTTFKKAYSADLKDFHSTGVLCIHVGLPMSVVASGSYNKPSAFHSVTKETGGKCYESLVQLCEQMQKSPEDEVNEDSPRQCQTPEKAKPPEKNSSDLHAAPPDDSSVTDTQAADSPSKEEPSAVAAENAGPTRPVRRCRIRVHGEPSQLEGPAKRSRVL